MTGVLAIVGVVFVIQLFVSILQTHLIITSIKNSCDKASKYKMQTLADKLKLLTEIDNTMSMMHNKLDDIALKMKACMAGLDDSTKKIFADLTDAVETSNVGKLASVVRAAQALSDNFDSIKNRIKEKKFKKWEVIK